MPEQRKRPLSPHLSIWRWGPHMVVSAASRIFAIGLATVGAAAFVWWLVAAASGPEAYADFVSVARSWFGVLVGIGLSLAIFFHGAAGIRFFVLDIGAGYELRTNKLWSIITMVVAVALTALLWIYIFLRAGS
jgi:succinate dehydrogenase / fumarate reductase cytochrome b subunit